jgi:predicted amidohydrolase
LREKIEMKVGIGQIRSGSDPWLNLALVAAFLEEARDQRCELVCFPENVLYRGPKVRADGGGREEAYLKLDSEGRIDRSTSFGRSVAEVLEAAPCTVSLGSVLELAGGTLPYNSHWVVGRDGRVLSYKKIHLFIYESATGGGSYREASEVHAGSETVVAPVGEFHAGLSICFDLRFPELFRDLSVKKGADLLLIPAAFTRETGEAHWHTLQRARAVENLSFVVAAGQWGTHVDSKGQELWCYGHSLVVDPWGRVIADGPAEGDALVTAELDLAEVKRRRSSLPVFSSVSLL